MTDHEFRNLVRRMRRKQVRFETTRNLDVKKEMDRLEAEVDAELDGSNKQPTLFGEPEVTK